MQGVQAGGDLHLIGGVDRILVGHVDPCFLQRRAACREVVLNYPIPCFLGVGIGGHGGSAPGPEGFRVGDAQSLEATTHLLVGVGSDSVDHGQREGDLVLVSEVVAEAFFGQAPSYPLVSHLSDGLAEPLPVS